jgi:hypothetical protein
MPEFLLSPVSVLSFQAGDSFDMSTLLVSMLTGVGYDAYVVAGYAPLGVVKNDQSKQTCPLLEAEARQASVEKGTGGDVGKGAEDAASQGKYRCD